MGKTWTLNDLSFPEGFQAQPAELQAILGIMNTAGSRKATVSGLLGLAHKLSSEAQAAGVAALENERRMWRDTVAKHPEFGGPKLEATKNAITSLIKEHGSKELEDLLTVAGIGDHPALVSFLAKMSAGTREASPGPMSKGNPAAGNSLETALGNMFPTHKKG